MHAARRRAFLIVWVVTLLRRGKRGLTHRCARIDSLAYLLPAALSEDVARFAEEQRRHAAIEASMDRVKVRRAVPCRAVPCRAGVRAGSLAAGLVVILQHTGANIGSGVLTQLQPEVTSCSGVRQASAFPPHKAASVGHPVGEAAFPLPPNQLFLPSCAPPYALGLGT